MKMATIHEYIRFGLVGCANTCLDLGVFALLSYAGLAVLPAIIISTSCGLTLSFILNRRFTFRSSSSTKCSLVSFLVITLVGLWILQPVIMWVCFLFFPVAFSTKMLAKIIATGCTMIWNYVWYKRVVFPAAP